MLSIEEKATAKLADGGITAKWGKNIDNIKARKSTTPLAVVVQMFNMGENVPTSSKLLARDP